MHANLNCRVLVIPTLMVDIIEKHAMFSSFKKIYNPRDNAGEAPLCRHSLLVPPLPLGNNK